MDNQATNSSTSRIPLNQCRKIFVQRDFSRGLVVRFQPAYPQELQGRIDESTWQKTINDLNMMYEEAEKVGARSAFETLAGCFSCYLSHLCVHNQYDRQLKKIARTLEEQNLNIYIPRGLFITDPIERGLRVVEISFLNEPATTNPNRAGQPGQ